MEWLSLLPALTTIILTFKTKKLLPSLMTGVVIGALLVTRSLLEGIIAIGGYIIDAVADRDSAYTLGFLIAFGALADLIEMAGGIAGFSEKVSKWVKSEKGVFSWAWWLSVFTFFDSSFHIIAVGTMLRPLTEKVKGSKDKFAFILSVTSLQLILLIPIATAYLGYMITLVTNNIRGRDIGQGAYAIVAKSVVWNFFSWAMLALAILVTLFGMGFGRFRLGGSGEEKPELTKGHQEKEELSSVKFEEYPRNATNLLLPIIFLLLTTVFFFWWTGRGAGSFWAAMTEADFNASIFAGVVFTILMTTVYFLWQRISLAEIEAHIIQGAEKVISLVLILVLSWALTLVTEQLGFNSIVGEGLVKFIPRFMIPAAVFLISGVISYTIGSSWATWALMMPVAITFATTADIGVPLMVGTVWAGGAVADVVSPLSAEISGTTFANHLATSFPWVVIGVIIALAGYLAVGLSL